MVALLDVDQVELQRLNADCEFYNAGLPENRVARFRIGIGTAFGTVHLCSMAARMTQKVHSDRVHRVGSTMDGGYVIQDRWKRLANVVNSRTGILLFDCMVLSRKGRVWIYGVNPDTIGFEECTDDSWEALQSVDARPLVRSYVTPITASLAT